MARRRRLIACAGAAVLALLLSGVLPPATAAPFGEYSYEELHRMGIDTGPTPADVGLPPCEPPSGWDGFASAEEAEAAVTDNEVDSCMADPAQASYWLGLPPPAPFSGGGR